MDSKIRRVVTGHDGTGKAVVLMDGEAPRVSVRKASGIGSALLWVTDSTPADLSGQTDAGDREIDVAPPRGGSIFRIVEFPPEKAVGDVRSEDMLKEMGLQSQWEGGEPPRHPGMHRTESIDYAVVMSGEIDMLLDDSEVHLKAGDVVVQRGTNHAWANRGDESCKIAFVLIDAQAKGD